MWPDHSKPCREGQRALGLMLAFIQGQFGDRSVALDGPRHHYPRARRWLLPLLAHLGRKLSWVTSPFTTPGEKTGCSLGESTLVRKEPGEGQPWGNVRNVQGETHHVLYRHPLSCCPCARNTEASGLLLSSQKRLGLGRYRTLAPENEGHF